jgi:hypothetical protein
VKPPADTARITETLEPLFKWLGPERAQILRHALNEAAVAVAPLIRLWSVEADTAAARARIGVLSAARQDELARHVGSAISRAEARLAETWERITRLAIDQEDAALAAALNDELDLGPTATSETFDAMMRNPLATLDLTPPRRQAVFCSSLAGVAVQVTQPPLLSVDAFAGLTSRVTTATGLANTPDCGKCVRGPVGEAVVLGDGTAVTVRDGTYVIEPASHFAETHVIAAFRLASGKVPVLFPSARAALASCLVSRSQTDANLTGFASRALWGGEVTDHTTPTAVVLRIGRLLRDLGEVESPDLISAVLGEVAVEVFKVHVRLGAELGRSVGGPHGLPIDVGRVRWDRLADRPVFWIPLSARDGDVVGGSDLPWTADPPSVGAHWHSQPPSLSLDPSWHAQIVVLPGTANLWAIDPHGDWWNMDADFDSMLAARRGHLEPWFDALDSLGILLRPNQRSLPESEQASDELISREEG